MNNTRKIKVGSAIIGGGSPVTIQSMLAVKWSDIDGNVAQAVELEQAGCEILRVAIPNMSAIPLITAIKSAIKIPLVADIHYDYRLAIEAANAGIDKIRINPGNIGGKDKVKAVVDACKPRGIPIRIGVNGGSLERHILEKYGAPIPEALAESALYHAALLEEFDFTDIVISIKSSTVKNMIEANRILSTKCNYPLHLGVTEAGTSRMGLIRSAVGIGSLLLDGIGDTIRVTLTAPPVEEIIAAKDILKSIDMHKSGITIVSCPTCGRTSIDIISLTKQTEEALKDYTAKLTVAVMGCVVNGPGEAREADVAICGGEDCGALFVKDRLIAKLAPHELIPALIKEVDKIVELRSK